MKNYTLFYLWIFQHPCPSEITLTVFTATITMQCHSGKYRLFLIVVFKKSSESKASGFSLNFGCFHVHKFLKGNIMVTFLSGKSQWQNSLAGYSPWGHKRVGYKLVTKQQPSGIFANYLPTIPSYAFILLSFISDSAFFCTWVIWKYTYVLLPYLLSISCILRIVSLGVLY